MFGLTDENILEIKKTIALHSNIEQALIFGSRAMGNYKTTSDVDIVIKGKKITHETIIAINEKLNEESLMPYQFDIINFNTINNSKLLEHINKYAIEI